MQKGNLVYLSLGSNLGNRMNYLKQAIKQLDNIENTHVIAVSSIYETTPIGYTDQGDFLNCCVKLSTLLKPLELLKNTSQIELSLKRERHFLNSPRTIDIDILLYNNEELNLPKLTIPHPRMMERAFVLVPLEEIADSQLKTTTNAQIKKISSQGVTKYDKEQF